jgi:orotate phosphoribosyltransferase
MWRNEDYWINKYKQLGALWIHDGNPKRPHALLTSGNPSNGFFNSRLVIAVDTLMREVAKDLIGLFIENGGDIEKIDIVVGPQTGATKLAEFLSDEITSRRGRLCRWASPAKHEEGDVKTMVFDDPERTVQRDNMVLLSEDVATTIGSINRTARATIEKGGVIIPCVVMLVNRSGCKETTGKKLVALIDKPMPIWPPVDCPLCKEGSEAIRPKDNWAALNADY